MNAPVRTDKMLSRKEGKVGYLTFNNPERHNAVSLEMWEAASGYLDDFRNDDNIRVVVITGAGGKVWADEETALPPTKISPDVGSTNPAISRRVVVLPQPEGPSRQTSCPCSMVNDTSSTTAISP